MSCGTARTTLAVMYTFVLIAASRGWGDPQPVEARLAEVYGRVGTEMFVVHSERQGADRTARDWCERWHVTHKEFTADFDEHDHLAGARRNSAMVDFVIEQRIEFGAAVELALFRLDGDESPELMHLIERCRLARVPGTVVLGRAA